MPSPVPEVPLTLSRSLRTAALIGLLSGTPVAAQSDDDASVSFVRLVETVENALTYAADELYTESDLEAISSAELSVAVEVSTEVEGGFKLFFFNLGGSREASTVSTITLVYEDVSPDAGYETSADYQVIGDAIVNATRAAMAAPSLSRLSLTSYTVDLHFAVKYVGEGGFEIEFAAGAVSGGGSLAREATNSLTLTFDFAADDGD